jgi:hypothetical protein
MGDGNNKVMYNMMPMQSRVTKDIGDKRKYGTKKGEREDNCNSPLTSLKWQEKEHIMKGVEVGLSP